MARGHLAFGFVIGLAAVGFGTPAAADAGVSVRFGGDPASRPFPSDRFTVPDWDQVTFHRVNLPKPDCAVRPTDCDDIELLNTLDGFNTQPRVTIPFTGDIDPATVSSDTVYLLDLGDVQTGEGFGQRVGINQAVWDVASRTLAFESAELLMPQSRYLVVVTDGIRDTSGKRLRPLGLEAGDGPPDPGDWVAAARDLSDARQLHRGVDAVAAASLFTTRSVSATLVKIRDRLRASTPAPVDFAIGTGGARTVYTVGSLSGVQYVRQSGTAPAFAAPASLNLGLLGASAQIAYGSYRSVDYQTDPAVIPATPTLTGEPQVQRTNELVFQLILPGGPRPAAGWPVAIFNHGNGSSFLNNGMWRIAGQLVSQGVATIAIHAVGNGGGAASTVNVLRAGQPTVVLPAGGRSIDLNGDGVIGTNEGSRAAAPRQLLGNRDAMTQTVIDLLQLVRQIELGIDVDGDGSPDLDANRVWLVGQSFGANHGAILLGLDPRLAGGALNVAGGSAIESVRLGGARPALAGALASRVPSLINIGGTVFDEAIPLRDRPILINTTPGAFAIADAIEHEEWLQQSANPVAWAPYLRKRPLPGAAPKSMLLQFAKADQTAPNPTNSALMRAGDLADRATFYRHDLAYALNPTLLKDPHTFLTSANAGLAPIGLQAVVQIAVFLGSGGTVTIDPDGADPLFETPIPLPLPETTDFIP